MLENDSHSKFYSYSNALMYSIPVLANTVAFHRSPSEKSKIIEKHGLGPVLVLLIRQLCYALQTFHICIKPKSKQYSKKNHKSINGRSSKNSN